MVNCLRPTFMAVVLEWNASLMTCFKGLSMLFERHKRSHIYLSCLPFTVCLFLVSLGEERSIEDEGLPMSGGSARLWLRTSGSILGASCSPHNPYQDNLCCQVSGGSCRCFGLTSQVSKGRLPPDGGIGAKSAEQLVNRGYMCWSGSIGPGAVFVPIMQGY